jgi:hypothetical protein
MHYIEKKITLLFLSTHFLPTLNVLQIGNRNPMNNVISDGSLSSFSKDHSLDVLEGLVNVPGMMDAIQTALLQNIPEVSAMP